MTSERDRRADAVERLRQAFRHAGHVMYGAASDIGRDQTSDTVMRAIVEVVRATQTVTECITELTGTERESERKSEGESK